MEIKEIKDGIDISELPDYFIYNNEIYGNKFTVEHLGESIRNSVLESYTRMNLNIISKDTFEKLWDNGAFYKKLEKDGN